MKCYKKTVKGYLCALRCSLGSGQFCIVMSRTQIGIPKLLVALLLLTFFGNLKPLHAASGLAAPLKHMPIYGDYDWELREPFPRADGYDHVDTPALIARLIQGDVSTYAYLVLHSPSDWDDFRLEFLPAAQAAGINVWLYLAPPTEISGSYPPYGTDYVTWATQAGMLAQRYPALTGLAIDDFDSNETTPFTPSYVNSMMAAAHAYSPGMAFLPVNYDSSHDNNIGKTISTTFVNAYGQYCSGVIFPYLNWSGNNGDYSGEAANISKNASILGSIPMIVMIYDGGYGTWTPDANYLTQANIIAQSAVAAGKAKGIIQYKMDKSSASSQFPIIQGLYAQWAVPTYDFSDGFNGWYSGNSLTAATWYNQDGWPGIIYADQTGADAFFYGPAISYPGRSNDVVQVQVYPEYGNTANHQMKLYWTTSDDGTWSESKSTSLVSYVAQNSWATITLPAGINANWNGHWITNLRLDVDDNTANSVGTRWIIDSVYVNPTPTKLTDNFNSGFDGWWSGNSLTAATWYNQSGWPGVIYADQTGADAFFYGPTMSLQGQANDIVQVHVYPQNGPTANHQMKLYWTTSADGTWSESKSTPLTDYVAQNTWATLNLPVGTLWQNNTITQMRLDMDDNTSNSVGTRWIIDYVNVIQPARPAYEFDDGFDGWFSGNSLTAATWYNQDGWPGVIYADQTGADAFFYGPSGMNYEGQVNDTVQVHVYPQNGSTANHQMKLYWTTTSDGTWSESKSTSLVSYVAQNAWTTVNLPVGSNSLWRYYTINQIRLDVDDDTTNSVGTRWLIDSVNVIPQ